MVNGLDCFRKYFANFSGSYILIGGTACNLNLSRQQLEFRATRDLDIVLCVEALDREFFQEFWKFIQDGQYTIAEKSTGQKQFYRFQKPKTDGFPAMLELFSRRPELQGLAEYTHLTPIPADEESSSLSAILLDDDYYQLIITHRILIENLSVISPEALIILKAKAWMDLCNRRNNGEKIDSKNISKHKNDIARILPLIAGSPISMPSSIKQDMQAFLSQFAKETIDTRALRLPFSQDEILQIIATIFDA